MTVSRSCSKNICSVRTRPMPSTPNPFARRTSRGVSAFPRTPIVRNSSAQLINFSKSSPKLGSTNSGAPHSTCPVAPSRVITAPSVSSVPSGSLRVFPFVSIETSSAPTIHGNPRVLATTAACELMPPRSVKMPAELCMPRISSGVVSWRTRIALSPRASAAIAALAVKNTLPVPAPVLAPIPSAICRRFALGEIWGCSISLSWRGKIRLMPSFREINSHSTNLTIIATAPRPLRSAGTASRSQTSPFSTVNSSFIASL